MRSCHEMFKRNPGWDLLPTPRLAVEHTLTHGEQPSTEEASQSSLRSEQEETKLPARHKESFPRTFFVFIVYGVLNYECSKSSENTVAKQQEKQNLKKLKFQILWRAWKLAMKLGIALVNYHLPILSSEKQMPFHYNIFWSWCFWYEMSNPKITATVTRAESVKAGSFMNECSMHYILLLLFQSHSWFDISMKACPIKSIGVRNCGWTRRPRK